MSLTKSATRLSLLAGSSLILSALAFTGATLAPTAALAANECGDPSANGGTADVLICPPGAYATGIDYSTTSNGNLTVILRDRVDTGTSNTAGSGPILMYGKTGESMSLLREDTVGVVGDPRIVNATGAGRAIDVSTLGSGNIVINLTDGDPTAGEPTTPVATAPAPMRITGSTDAVRADAQGAGSVNVTFAPTGTPSGVLNPLTVITAGSAVGSNGSGIVARSTTGAINIETRGATFSINGANGGSAIDAVSTSGNVTITAGAASGRLRGILAQTGGAGTVSVTATNGASANFATGLAGIDTVAGTGATTITITGGTVSGGSGAAIRSVSTSTSATAAVNVQNTGGTVSGRVDFSGVTAGGVTFANTGATSTTGRWTATGASTFSGFNDTLTMSGVGANTMASGSSLSFGAGGDIFNMSAALAATSAAIDFGTGNDIFNVSGTLTTTNSTIDFGAGTDAFNMSGTLTAGGVLTLSNLEAFNTSGTIYLGGTSGAATDLTADDVLRMTSGTFTGSGDSRVVMDVMPGSGQQAGCATVTFGDCLDLRGASTAGVTVLTLNDVSANSATQGGFDPVGITLVDVGGAGTSAAGHFVLDPASSNFLADPVLGGVITRPGLFGYALRYDPETQRHVLVGLPRGEVLEYTVLSSAASSIWHMTAEAVNERQTDLRAGAEGVVWLRTTGEYTKRSVSTAFDSFGETFLIDNGYKLYAGTIMGGMDFAAGTSGGYDYVVGGQIGYVGSSFDLNASESSGRFSGATGGVYGSIWTERFFLDGTFNMNGLTLDYDSPGLGSKTNTFVNAFGARLDGGLRHRLTETIFAEPLASVAFVRTSFEEISLSGGEIQPADAQSRRAALGLRVGADFAGASVNWSYFLTGRAWNEFDGESGGAVHNPGVDLPFTDDFSGTFGEAEAGLGLANDAGTVSGFLASGVKFKDGYSAVDLSGGLRLRW